MHTFSESTQAATNATSISVSSVSKLSFRGMHLDGVLIGVSEVGAF